MSNKKIKLTNKEEKMLLSLGDNIRKKRIKLKLSQADLAKKSGLDRSYISMVERGIVNITYLKLKKIEKILNFKF